MAKASKMRRVATMDVIEIAGQPNGLCIVMMHGYGADAQDLVSLANVLYTPAGTTWLFPNGSLQVPIGPHVYGRGWFPINIEAMDKARLEGTFRDLSKETPSGLKKCREQIYQMLGELNIPISKVIFAGFSQGAMLATALTLFSPESPRGLIILSGALLDEKLWTEKAKNRAGLSFYQSHGTHDQLLSLEGAIQLERTLTGAGLKGKLQIFEGGHEIPQEVIHGVNNYMRGLGTS